MSKPWVPDAVYQDSASAFFVLEKKLLSVFTIMGMADILFNDAELFEQSVNIPSTEGPMWNLVKIGQVVLEKTTFKDLMVTIRTSLGEERANLVLFVRLFDLCFFGFISFFFLLVSGKGCGLWLWHSLDFSLTFFIPVYSTRARADNPQGGANFNPN